MFNVENLLLIQYTMTLYIRDVYVCKCAPNAAYLIVNVPSPCPFVFMELIANFYMRFFVYWLVAYDPHPKLYTFSDCLLVCIMHV